MELEMNWVSEDVVDNDEQIQKVEAEIARDKAILSRLAEEDDLF